jgi:hypothetical protein
VIKQIIGRIREFFTVNSNVVSRIVRTAFQPRLRSSWWQPSNDWSRSDYDYWRRAYYCRVRGLEISGLFIRPLVSKIAGWTLGRAPNFKLESEASREALDNWWDTHHSRILKAFKAALKQGDAFLVVNSDLSLTLVRPDAVDPIVAEDDYTLVIGWRVWQVLQHPERFDRMSIVDEYYADRRVHRVERNGVPIQEITYPNLIGRMPIIHIANQPDEGETFGHAEAEALIEVLHRYGEIFEAAIEGNKLQGRPTPVISFESVADLDRFWADYATATNQTLPDGRTESYKTLSVDLSQLLAVSGADFKYASPGEFAADTERLLGLMFYLILEHTELPEFIFGNAIASSKASAETQMPVFEKFIEDRRGQVGEWLLELASIVLAYLALIEPGVTVEEPAIQWHKLTQDGRLTLDTITWGLTEGLLDRRTALMLAPVEVEDIDQVLDTAQTEKQEREAAAQENAIAMAAVKQPVRPGVTEMAGDYLDQETRAIVAAAERIVARGD